MEPSMTRVDQDQTVTSTDLNIIDLENPTEVENHPPEAPAPARPQRSVFERLYPGSRPRRSLKKKVNSGRNQPTKPQRRQQQRTGNRERPRSTQPEQPSSVVIDVPTELELNPTATPPESDHSTRETLDRRDSSHNEETLSTVSLILLEQMQPTRLKSAKPPRHRKPHTTNSSRIERIPTALVERTSLARGALPILPCGWAWICLVFNAFVPGTGTFLSGLLAVCCGAPRFSSRVTWEQRLVALLVNIIVGLLQAITVIFCLVGWCWSLGWGIILVRTADDYKHWKRRRNDSINIIANDIKEDPENDKY